MTSIAQRFQRHRHQVLLIALLIMAMAQPLAHGVVGGLLLFDVLLTLVVAGVVAAVFKRHRQRSFALGLAIPAIAARWAAHSLTGDARLVASGLHHVLVIAFMGYAIFIILWGIFEEKDIRLDHFAGTICGYLLAGIVWGNCYVLADLANSGAFKIAPEIASRIQDEHTRAFYFNYYSLCTLTGAAFGDVTPLGPVVATLTWLEAGFGQFYIAVVVAQLVGIAFPRRR